MFLHVFSGKFSECTTLALKMYLNHVDCTRIAFIISRLERLPAGGGRCAERDPLAYTACLTDGHPNLEKINKIKPSVGGGLIGGA
jgi:hypothetical protein